MKKLSAKKFKAPLLVVLAEMSDWKPGVAVIFADTYQSVCNAIGIDGIESHGIQETTGKPWVEQWIGWAFRALKKEELASAPRRGRWALTDAGVDLARTYQKTGQVTVAVPALPDSAVAAKAAVEATERCGSSMGLDFTDLEIDLQEEKIDPYIQSLLVGEAKCLGKWSERSTMCGTCPVLRACKNFMRSELSALAEKMEREEKRALKTKKNGESGEEVDLDELLNGRNSTKSPVRTSTIKAALDSVCEACGKKISRGEECYWDTGDGLYHKGCVDKPE